MVLPKKDGLPHVSLAQTPTLGRLERTADRLVDVPTLLVLSVLLLVVFGFWERHLERNTTFPPIVKFSLFTRHQYKVLVIVVSTFFIVISVYGFVYLITIFYQSHLGLSPLDTAIRTLPCTIVGCVAAVRILPSYCGDDDWTDSGSRVV